MMYVLCSKQEIMPKSTHTQVPFQNQKHSPNLLIVNVLSLHISSPLKVQVPSLCLIPIPKLNLIHVPRLNTPRLIPIHAPINPIHVPIYLSCLPRLCLSHHQRPDPIHVSKVLVMPHVLVPRPKAVPISRLRQQIKLLNNQRPLVRKLLEFTSMIL